MVSFIQDAQAAGLSPAFIETEVARMNSIAQQVYVEDARTKNMAIKATLFILSILILMAVIDRYRRPLGESI
jgi:hypothetical protein